MTDEQRKANRLELFHRSMDIHRRRALAAQRQVVYYEALIAKEQAGECVTHDERSQLYRSIVLNG